MRLAAFDLYRYRLPLTAPLPIGGRALEVREGVLIRWQSASGAVGWGEVAPLPGFSAEPIEVAVAHLRRLRSVLSVLDPAAPPADGAAPLPPSVRFGVDLAWAGLMAAEAGRPLPQVLAPEARPTVALNALLMGRGDDVAADARRCREAGYSAVKLKVGRASVREDAARVRRVAEALGPDVALRLDANRAWTLDQAVAFAGAVAGVPIAYVEEPLADPAVLPALVAQTGLPVALDESMTAMTEVDLARHTYARAVVLKPTLVGGLFRALRLGWAAHRLGMQPVVSAAFESGVGLQGLLALAAVLPATPAGLDTYRRLARDVVRPRLALGRPVVEAVPPAGTGVTLAALDPLEDEGETR